MSLPNLETSFGYRYLEPMADHKVPENSTVLNQSKSILKSLQLGKLRQKFLSKINASQVSFDNGNYDHDHGFSNVDQYDCEVDMDSYPWSTRGKLRLNKEYDQEYSSSVPSSPRFLSHLRQSNRFYRQDDPECQDYKYYDSLNHYNFISPHLYHLSNTPYFSVSPIPPIHSCIHSQFQSPLNQRKSLSPYYAQSSNIPYQEIREIYLLKNPSEKYGFKIEKIGMGIFITNLLPDSPAVKAGLKVGDEILHLNNRVVCNLTGDDLIHLIKAAETTMKVSYKPRLIVMRLRDVIIRKTEGRLGIRLQKRPEGIFLAIVISNSPASRAGLKEGDELLKINDEVISEWSQERVTQYLRDINTDETDLLLILREYLPVADVSPYPITDNSDLDYFNELNTGINKSATKSNDDLEANVS